VWSRVRHRRLQALSLIALAALLTTSLCLGPLYQRSMEQALAGSVLAGASPDEKAVRLTAANLSPQELEGDLPADLDPYFTDPIVSRTVPVSVNLPDTTLGSVATRLYAVDGACAHLTIVEGSCPSAAGEVMVSSDDVEVNGWTVGSTVKYGERLDPVLYPDSNSGKVRIVGVYRPPAQDDDWLGVPITGRAGFDLQDVGTATDDWVTDPATMSPAQWHLVTTSVVWSLDPDTVGHDELLQIGPAVTAANRRLLDNPGEVRVLMTTNIPSLAEQVATGSEQGRTTVVVLVVQLLVLVAVVLWMVLVAATDDRRPEVALARLRGRGRRGAASYLLSELLPLTLGGVALGILVAPLAMAIVAKVVFPVPVPHELPGGFLLAALGSVVAVLAVVLAAARRAVREPVDSLLRAVRARHTGGGTGAAEVTLVVFSLTAVAALVTGNLEGPLATLAPTLLAVAAGLLLGRALGPATRALAGRLLRSGRAVAAAGIVNAARRPSARRVLVMVVVASALFVFCVDALVTGQHNRQNAAEQELGAPYSLGVRSTSLVDVVAAVEAADPDHQHLTPVVTTPQGASVGGPTVSVDSQAFPKVAYFPLSSPEQGHWSAIAPPSRDPLQLKGTTLAGTVASAGVRLTGPARDRTDQLRIGLELLESDGSSGDPSLSVIPIGDGTATFQVPVRCADGCVVTGITIATPPGGASGGTVVLRDLTVDGAPFSLGPPTAWRRGIGTGGSVVPTADAAGNLGALLNTSGSEPPVMLSAWVPQPVPALVSSSEERLFSAAALVEPIDMTVVGRLPRVPGSPPGSRVVDVEGLLRRADTDTSGAIVEVWSDDAGALDRARAELRKRGVSIDDLTTIGDVRADLDASPAAWSLALSVLVGAAAVLVAMLAMVVATATTWRARATDLAALRMAGLPARSLRRMELLGQLPVVLVGGVTGAVCGIAAGVLALPGVRQFTDPPAVDTTDFSTPWAAVILASVAALVLLTALALATSRWTARRATLNRIREVV
jgi:putative ABC transport system permease protein